MSTNISRPQDSCILGESWVVASPDGENEPQANCQPFDPSTPTPQPRPRPARKARSYGSESISTSTSSLGPELIMPSIYEAPPSEASWVAPASRSKRSLRQRHPTEPRHSTPEKKQTSPPRKQDSTTPTTTRKSPSNKPTQYRPWTPPTIPSLESSLRAILNLVLIAAITHMLVLPELVQQYQTLCSLEALATLYPSSCIPLYPQAHPVHHQPIPQEDKETVISSQTRLESLFNATLYDMAPLSTTLKHSESKLRDIHHDLKKAYPGSKHELDLEFTGCLQATRTAARKFDSLQADIRSAVDSLIATGDARTLVHDARLSTQMARREQYLEQLTSRMHSKADSLSNDLATLDDHLESIGGIVDRESKHSPSPQPQSNTDTPTPPNSNSNSPQEPPTQDQQEKHTPRQLNPFSLLGLNLNLPSLFRPSSSTTEPSENTLITNPSHHHHPLIKLFRDAATNHHPVIRVVRNMSNQLQTLHKRKNPV
ncbi:hypothetical protein BO70DRAFT_132537 [Aspergillus heteromorphus CBS 117.55]|uniref:Uncharacterized protein n=1 Tax=Aspergillus heteromorphus CBS 117.55 TaxID=1448321 RepID=A0A317WVA0_9EURO|nr:uncharacterized protein BO70DRAFT_132537 [Aspergillus heteromorphus CBS 117.55]PWY90005.1 hypothetical protein BO70DRAFT_132537 [Aspergillus heteromorphus CBS 117.55]